jgi:hypothetical protein
MRPLNSVCKRLNLYGYRHYHDSERWMKRLLVESVEKVLLSPDSLSRGMYHEAALCRLLEETRRGVVLQYRLFALSISDHERVADPQV